MIFSIQQRTFNNRLVIENSCFNADHKLDNPKRPRKDSFFVIIFDSIVKKMKRNTFRVIKTFH